MHPKVRTTFIQGGKDHGEKKLCKQGSASQGNCGDAITPPKEVRVTRLHGAFSIMIIADDNCNSNGDKKGLFAMMASAVTTASAAVKMRSEEERRGLFIWHIGSNVAL